MRHEQHLAAVLQLITLALNDHVALVLLLINVRPSRLAFPCPAQAVNQHDESEALQKNLAKMEAIIRDARNTLFCMDAQGIALTRAWCLSEIW
jgi:hypothetical protein